jgi:ORF6N domain
MKQEITILNKIKILNIRGYPVIVDRSLAELYGVSTKVMNQTVKRNALRFPDHYMFQLTKPEFNNWKSQFVTSNGDHMGLRKLPFVFTEHGVAMLAGLLKSNTAIQISIAIIDQFVRYRQLDSKFQHLDQRVLIVEEDVAVQKKQITQLLDRFHFDKKPNQGIFFNNQIFDAYTFSSDLIKSAKTSVILVDNYIDETTLLQLSKRNTDVTCVIYTERITPEIQLDLEKHNAQYSPIEIRILKNTHDRFLIIDNKELYHLGASLKDLGKRWFAFSRIDGFLNEVMTRLD